MKREHNRKNLVERAKKKVGERKTKQNTKLEKNDCRKECFFDGGRKKKKPVNM